MNVQEAHNMLQLFLSYASEDVDRVRQLTADLHRVVIEPWMDDELKLAGRWNDEIDGRIRECDFFLPILSRSTQVGDLERFFQKEWRLAYEAQRQFLPVRLEECQLPTSLPHDLTIAIEQIQRVDLFPSYDDGLRQLLRFLIKEKRTAVFEETFSCLGADNTGWRMGNWEFDASDSSGAENSGSIRGKAQLTNTRLLPQTIRQTAAIDIDLPARSMNLRYRRRLQLSAPVGGKATFQLAIDGEVIDAASQTDQTDQTEDDWISRSVPVPDRGAHRAILELTVIASSTLNYFPSAEAWVDDLCIA
jgi:hypothetical protein